MGCPRVYIIFIIPSCCGLSLSVYHISDSIVLWVVLESISANLAALRLAVALHRGRLSNILSLLTTKCYHNNVDNDNQIPILQYLAPFENQVVCWVRYLFDYLLSHTINITLTFKRYLYILLVATFWNGCVWLQNIKFVVFSCNFYCFFLFCHMYLTISFVHVSPSNNTVSWFTLHACSEW